MSDPTTEAGSSDDVKAALEAVAEGADAMSAVEEAAKLIPDPPAEDEVAEPVHGREGRVRGGRVERYAFATAGPDKQPGFRLVLAWAKDNRTNHQAKRGDEHGGCFPFMAEQHTIDVSQRQGGRVVF